MPEQRIAAWTRVGAGHILAGRRRRLRVLKRRIIRCKEARRANGRACADGALECAERTVAADRDRGEAERDGHQQREQRALHADRVPARNLVRARHAASALTAPRLCASEPGHAHPPLRRCFHSRRCSAHGPTSGQGTTLAHSDRTRRRCRRCGHHISRWRSRLGRGRHAVGALALGHHWHEPLPLVGALVAAVAAVHGTRWAGACARQGGACFGNGAGGAGHCGIATWRRRRI
mmetsp:Transcript_24104/g.64669  ORF Transcript_24104/g.64669 Transcript_24104/m.64669 type:complete len:234 (-) Transcript_24104:399-1100(-)